MPHLNAVRVRLNCFVKNFVDVDFEQWQSFISNVPSEARTFIKELQRWCGDMVDGKEWVPTQPEYSEPSTDAERIIDTFTAMARASGVFVSNDTVEALDALRRDRKKPKPKTP